MAVAAGTGREITAEVILDEGEPLDFARAYAEYHPQAIRWATAILGDPDAAGDVVQESFVRIFSSPRRLRRPEAFGPYLRRTIVRTAASRWRTIRRDEGRAVRAYRLDGDRDGDAADDRSCDPELLAAVRRLPPRQQMVIVLRFWLDWSERDIATALGCRPGTVKSLASRALDTLRTEVGRD